MYPAKKTLAIEFLEALKHGLFWCQSLGVGDDFTDCLVGFRILFPVWAMKAQKILILCLQGRWRAQVPEGADRSCGFKDARAFLLGLLEVEPMEGLRY